MVECKNGVYDELSGDSPPLVRAEPAIVGLHVLEPIGVTVVSIDGDPLCQEASVISNDSTETMTGVSEDHDNTNESSQAWSAGIAGGVVGTLVGGPLTGLVAGGAAAYYSQRDGAAGDITRALGEVAQTTGVKARELNEKHQLVDKSKEAADAAWKKVKEMNNKHHVKDRSQAAATSAWENLKEFDRQHGVASKLKELAIFCFRQLVKLAEYAANRLQAVEQSEQSVNRAQQTAGKFESQHFSQSNQKLTQATAY